MARNLLLLAVTLAVLFGALEGAFRLFFPPPPTWREPQTSHLRSPLLGWVLPPDSRSYSIDAPVAVNSLGLRDDELPRQKPPGEVRVLALGDSFTFAMGVRFEDSWVQQLEGMLASSLERPVQVINAGVSGYNTRQELIYLLSEGLALEPDLVVVAFYWNDLVGNEAPLPDLASTPRLPDDPRPRRERPGHTIPRALRDRLRQSVLLYQTLRRTRQLLWPTTGRYVRVQQALLAGDREVLDPLWRDAGRRLLAIHEAATARGIPLVLMAFPMERQIAPAGPAVRFGEELQRIWAPTGMPLVDLEAPFRTALARGQNPFLPYDRHPNALGMRIAAGALHERILARSLLPRPEAPGDAPGRGGGTESVGAR